MRMKPLSKHIVTVCPPPISEHTASIYSLLFFRFYAPNNAVLAVTGNISFEEAEALTEKWFGSVPRRKVPARHLPQEPPQTEARRLAVERNVPLDALYMAIRRIPPPDICRIITRNKDLVDAMRKMGDRDLTLEQVKSVDALFASFQESREGEVRK